ncbi:MAG: C40 family peptidase [Lachnospiraceae bacterium]|nr:C40 family peptidase [Lachnospiraceae bacterium]
MRKHRFGSCVCEAVVLALAAGLLSGAAYAETGSPGTRGYEESAVSAQRCETVVSYTSVEPTVTAESDSTSAALQGAVETAEGVKPEMCVASYWYDKTAGSRIAADQVLLEKTQIRPLNEAILHADGANMHDLMNLESGYQADALRTQLAEGLEIPTRKIYVNGELLEDNAAYYGKLRAAITDTGLTGEHAENRYAVAVRRTILSSIPTSDYIGYSPTDADDEKVSSAINVNDPFVIRQQATVDGKIYYWGYSDACPGWVAADDLAVCVNKEEWLAAWRVDPEKEDFLVVTQNQITLEPSVSNPELSEVKLTFATVLKLVPEEVRLGVIGERGPWNNYMVYLPTRDADGHYVRRCALISQHYEVSLGFLQMTQKELLRVAFNNLGDRYGWGGMLDAMDCSLLTRNVYRCFGLSLPRNTNWQQTVPERKLDLSGMTDEEKLSVLRRMPAGTLLYFPGHTMIYTGTADYDTGEGTPVQMAYVISDTGRLSDSTGELAVRSMYSVILNPLNVRRAAGTTWLANLTAAVMPVSSECLEQIHKNLEEEGGEEPPVRVPAAEGQTYASSCDTLPLETFLGDRKNLYISFGHVADAEVKSLDVTALKGSRITTKVPVRKILCDSGVASVKINGKTFLGMITLKRSGTVAYEMESGERYEVHFTVETPKAQKPYVKQRLSASGVEDTVRFSVRELFGTRLDGGELRIVNQRAQGSQIEGNELILNRRIKNTVRISYRYLDCSCAMTITVR